MSYFQEVQVGDKTLYIETGRLAVQANGSVTIAIGETDAPVTLSKSETVAKSLSLPYQVAAGSGTSKAISR